MMLIIAECESVWSVHEGSFGDYVYFMYLNIIIAEGTPLLFLYIFENSKTII